MEDDRKLQLLVDAHTRVAPCFRPSRCLGQVSRELLCMVKNDCGEVSCCVLCWARQC